MAENVLTVSAQFLFNDLRKKSINFGYIEKIGHMHFPKKVKQ